MRAPDKRKLAPTKTVPRGTRGKKARPAKAKRATAATRGKFAVQSSVVAPDIEAFRLSAGGWKGHVDAEALIRQIYEDRLIQSRPARRL
jgi:hypothetical protein